MCVLFPFFFCSVLFAIKEGKGMMFFVVVLLTSDVCNKRREGYDAIFSFFYIIVYKSEDNSPLPPTSGWTIIYRGEAPCPTLRFL